jgi:hypothetical protein
VDSNRETDRHKNPKFENLFKYKKNIQGVTEMRGQILTRSYWLLVELGKNI